MSDQKTPPAARQPEPAVLNAVARIRVRMDEFPDRQSTVVNNEDLLTIFASIDTVPALLAAEYQRGVEDVLAIAATHHDHGDVDCILDLERHARALIPGPEVQR